MARGGSFERSLEGVFDGLFSRAFRSGVKPLQIGRRLLQVVDAERAVDGMGRRVVPNSYLVQLSTADREGFADLEMSLLQELTVAVREYISQEGYHVNGKARVALRTNSSLRRGKFTIEARHTGGSDEATATSHPTEPAAERSEVAHGDKPPAVLTLPTGQRIELHPGTYVVGRHLQSDIVVNDSNVSRRHAEIECRGADTYIRDLGSTNGTKVNGVMVHGDQLLRHGDVIGLGTVQLHFETN